LLPRELHQGINELDPQLEYFLEAYTIRGLEKQSGNCGLVLELVLDADQVEYLRQQKDALPLLLYLSRVDGFIELVDSLLEQFVSQLGFKAINLALYLSILHKVFGTYSCLNSRIAVLLNFCSIPSPATEKLYYFRIILDFTLLGIGQFI
jgi:hypothetical protein